MDGTKYTTKYTKYHPSQDVFFFCWSDSVKCRNAVGPRLEFGKLPRVFNDRVDKENEWEEDDGDQPSDYICNTVVVVPFFTAPVEISQEKN